MLECALTYCHYTVIMNPTYPNTPITRAPTAVIKVFFHGSRGSARTESDHPHRPPDRVGVLIGVVVDGAQNRLHGRGQQALRRNNVLCGDDVPVEPDHESNPGQVGVAADGLDELVAGA